jgi:hypothetical protein
MPWDPVDLGCDAVGKESLCPSVDLPCKSLPWARLQVCRSPNCGLSVAEDCHYLHSMLLQCFSLLDRHIKRESDRPQFGLTLPLDFLQSQPSGKVNAVTMTLIIPIIRPAVSPALGASYPSIDIFPRPRNRECRIHASGR